MHRTASRAAATMVATLLTGGFLAGCASGEPTGEAGPVEIEIATWGSPDHISITSFLPEFEAQLDELSDGRITIEHVEGGALAEDVDMPEALPRGTVVMGLTTVNGWSGAIPDTAIFDSPYLGMTMEQLNESMDAELGAALEQQFEDYGVHVLAWAQLGPTAFVSTEEVRVPSDLSGHVFRTYSEGGAAMLAAAGGSGAALPFAEVYTAIQRGSVDGAHVGLQGIESQRLYEITQYGTVPSTLFGTSMPAWAINLDWWNDLTDEDRQIVQQAADVAEASSREAIIDDRAQLIADYEGEGMTFFDLQPTDPEYDAWSELVGPFAEQDAERFSPEIIDAVDAAR